MSTGANCPASGYIPADVLDKDGFYHAMSGNSVANGYYGAGVLSQSAYEYFRNRPVGTIDNLQLNLCYMDSKADYDFASGVRCKDLPAEESGFTTMNLEKVSHLTLNSTGAMAEVWIASDGTPSVNLGSELCQMGVVGSASGIICKMVSYSFQETKTLTTSLDFRMVIDTTLLGFSLLRLTSSTAVMAPAGPISARLAPITRSSNRQGVHLCLSVQRFFKSSQGGHRFNQQR